MATSSPRQTSNKAGVRSLARKQDNSRHGFQAGPASRKVAGTSGQENRIRGSEETRAEAARGGKASALRKMKDSGRSGG
jgi:hypothetical protein